MDAVQARTEPVFTDGARGNFGYSRIARFPAGRLGLAVCLSGKLARQDAVLEERLNTTPAEYKTDIGWLAEQMAKSEAWMLLMVASIIAMGITVLGNKINNN